MKKQTWPALLALASMAAFNSCKKDGAIAPKTYQNNTTEESIAPPGYVMVDDMIISEKAMEVLTGKSPHIDKGTNVDLVHRWPNGVIPFELDASLSVGQKISITNAMEEYRNKTNIRFVERSFFNTDYITFRDGSSCSSAVGRIGGEQFITLTSNCFVDAVIHEIGHCIGMFHEHQRLDRDSHVLIFKNNIDNSKLPADREAANFDIFNTVAGFPAGTDHGAFDFSSIMMYEPDAFANTGTFTITDLAGGTGWANSNFDLSTGDVAAIDNMYPAPKIDLTTMGNTSGDVIGEVFIEGNHIGDARDDIFAIDANGGVRSYETKGPNNLPYLSTPGLMPGTNVGAPSNTQYFAGDFSNDGKMDLITLSGGVLKYYQLTHYYYTYLEYRGTINGFTNCGDIDLFVEDWDQDGKPDLMQRCGDNFTLLHSFNKDSRTFVATSAGSITGASGFTKIMSGDFETGSRPYLMLFVSGSSVPVRVRPFQGNGTFLSFNLTMISDFNYDDVSRFYVANWSGTHDDLMILTNNGELKFFEAHNNSSGLFIELRRWFRLTNLGWNFNGNEPLFIGNFSNDGAVDILRDQSTYNYINYYNWTWN